MATTRIADVIVPAAFTGYVVENTAVKTALLESTAISRNGVIEAQLQAGADMFTIPYWNDLGNAEPDISNDDPEDFSTPQKLTAARQRVRKAFLHQSWSSMQLAGELAGSDPLVALQNRVSAYWNRVLQRRIVASMQGIMASNLASNGGDMVVDISAGTGDAANFNSAAVIDAAATLGDSMGDVKSIFMHSHVYSRALKNDEIEFVQPSQGAAIATYRGMAVVVDDGMPVQGGVYVTALAGTGAFAFGVTAPLVAEGTETERVPSAGNGGGMEVLHSRVNLAVHPAGFDWTEGSVSADSPSPAELRLAANWQRVSERKLVPIAFLLTK